MTNLGPFFHNFKRFALGIIFCLITSVRRIFSDILPLYSKWFFFSTVIQSKLSLMTVCFRVRFALPLTSRMMIPRNTTKLWERIVTVSIRMCSAVLESRMGNCSVLNLLNLEGQRNMNKLRTKSVSCRWWKWANQWCNVMKPLISKIEFGILRNSWTAAQWRQLLRHFNAITLKNSANTVSTGRWKVLSIFTGRTLFTEISSLIT